MEQTYHQRYYQANKDKYQKNGDYDKDYYEKHKEEIKAKRRERYAQGGEVRTYGKRMCSV
jgi:hypothetical protein